MIVLLLLAQKNQAFDCKTCSHILFVSCINIDQSDNDNDIEEQHISHNSFDLKL